MAIDEFERSNLGQLKAGVQIFATDLSAQMLNTCRTGEYDNLAIGLGILFESQNIAFMVGLAFSIAASCNFPVLATIALKLETTRG